MDCVVILFQRFGQHSSPSTLVELDPIVYHIFYYPYETLCYIGVCERNDVSDAFIVRKKKFKFLLERHGHYHYKLTS
jgi:hypothetical protein